MPLESVCRKSVEEFEAMGHHSPGVLSTELNGALWWECGKTEC